MSIVSWVSHADSRQDKKSKQQARLGASGWGRDIKLVSQTHAQSGSYLNPRLATVGNEIGGVRPCSMAGSEAWVIYRSADYRTIQIAVQAGHHEEGGPPHAPAVIAR